MAIRPSGVGEQTWYIGFHCVVDNTTDFEVKGQGSNLGGGDSIVSFCLNNQVIQWIAYCINKSHMHLLPMYFLSLYMYLIILILPFYIPGTAFHILFTELYVYSGVHCSSWILGWDSWILFYKCKHIIFPSSLYLQQEKLG